MHPPEDPVGPEDDAEDELELEVDVPVHTTKKDKTGRGCTGARADRDQDVLPYLSMPYANLVEVVLYIVTGILLIFVMEQFIQIGVRIGTSGVILR